MTSKNLPPQSIDPVLQELWQVKDAINARFGSVSEYVAHLRSKSLTSKKPQKAVRVRGRLTSSSPKLEIAA